MNGRKAIVSLPLVCALFFCIAVPGAQGAKLNTTAVTCKPVETKAQFSDAHCTKAGEGKGFAHEAISVVNETTLSATNEGTGSETKSAVNAELRFEASEVEFEVVCPSITTLNGSIKNAEVTNEKKEKEMLVRLIKMEISYTKCTVLRPSKESCVVAGEKFQLNSTSNLTTSYGTKMSIEFLAPSGSITIEKCANESLNGKYPFGGTIRAEPNGATLNMTGAATALTFLVNGSPAELVSSLTLRARLSTEEATTPVSFTTG